MFVRNEWYVARWCVTLPNGYWWRNAVQCCFVKSVQNLTGVAIGENLALHWKRIAVGIWYSNIGVRCVSDCRGIWNEVRNYNGACEGSRTLVFLNIYVGVRWRSACLPVKWFCTRRNDIVPLYYARLVMMAKMRWTAYVCVEYTRAPCVSLRWIWRGCTNW